VLSVASATAAAANTCINTIDLGGLIIVKARETKSFQINNQ